MVPVRSLPSVCHPSEAPLTSMAVKLPTASKLKDPGPEIFRTTLASVSSLVKRTTSRPEPRVTPGDSSRDQSWAASKVMVTSKGHTTPASKVNGRSEWSPGVLGPGESAYDGAAAATASAVAAPVASAADRKRFRRIMADHSFHECFGDLHGGPGGVQAHGAKHLRSALTPPYSGHLTGGAVALADLAGLRQAHRRPTTNSPRPSAGQQRWWVPLRA